MTQRCHSNCFGRFTRRVIYPCFYLLHHQLHRLWPERFDFFLEDTAWLAMEELCLSSGGVKVAFPAFHSSNNLSSVLPSSSVDAILAEGTAFPFPECSSIHFSMSLSSRILFNCSIGVASSPSMSVSFSRNNLSTFWQKFVIIK